MRVEAHENLQKPLSFPATRVLITRDDGTPVCLAVEWQPGHLRIFRVGDKDFNDQLRMHGINRTVIVQRIQPEKLRAEK